MMVRYELMGYKSFEEYINDFMKTLMPSNKTYDFFVDWKRVKERVKRYIKEISILNSLTKVKNNERIKLLKEIFMNYPETIPVIPLMLAIDNNSVTILEITDKISFIKHVFERRVLSEDELDNLIEFCQKTGLLNIFDEIQDLYAYILGVEVGKDSNARKNRSGEIFQGLVELLIKNIITSIGLENKIRLKTEQDVRRYGLNIRRRNKKVDFVLIDRGRLRAIIECNFYNVPGSKPIEVASAYVDFNNMLRKKNVIFIWITDGPAWLKMKNDIVQAAMEIDYVLNLKLAEKHLPKIFLQNFEIQSPGLGS